MTFVIHGILVLAWLAIETITSLFGGGKGSGGYARQGGIGHFNRRR